jgi:hypothetical protein
MLWSLQIRGACIVWNVYLSGTCILGNVHQTCNLVNVYFRKHVSYGACRFVERVFYGTCI